MVSSGQSGSGPALLRAHPFLFVLAAVLAVAAAVLLHRHARGRLVLATEQRLLSASAIAAETGRCFTVGLGDVALTSRERPLHARLLEDGRELGPADCQHDAIRTQGGGRFSVWDGQLYFSTGDGSDPRTNGRRYELVWPTRVPVAVRAACNVLAVALSALAAFVVWRTRGQAFVRWAEGPLATGLSRAAAGCTGRQAWRLALLVALVAIAVRVVAYVLVQRDLAGHIGGGLVMGVPFSDAQGWDSQGESIMLGQGLVGNWSARRPFYAFVLGALYSWTGPSPFAAVVLNVLLGGLTAALVCRIGQRTCHPVVGFAAGLAFAVDPVSIEYSRYLLTETLGTFLFVLCLHQLVVALQEDRAGAGWWAGVAFALSNLTRTLTLLAAPLLALAVLWYGRGASRSWRRGIWLATVFSLGFLLPLSAWIVRQKVVHDLTTISDNTASGLYAAASPVHRTWSAAVDTEADAAGIPNEIKPRYDWFMRRFREELAADPGFYLRNAAASGAVALAGLGTTSKATRVVLVLLLLGAWLARLPRFVGSARTFAAWTLAVVVAGAAVWQLSGLWSMALAGVGLALLWRGNRLAVLLAASFVGTIAAVALFALGNEHRLLLMVSWIVPLGVATAYLAALAGFARWLGRGAPGAPVPLPAVAAYAPRWQRPLVVVVVVFFLLNLGFLGYRNFASPVPPLPPLPKLDVAGAQAALARLAELQPGAVAGDEPAAPSAWYQAVRSPLAQPQNHGRLVVAHARLARHRYPIEGGRRVEHWTRMFDPRPYDRLFTYATTRLPDGGAGPVCTVLAAPLPEAADRDLLVIGRANVDLHFAYEEVYLEVIAWARLGADGVPDLANLQVTTEPAHAALAAGLRR